MAVEHCIVCQGTDLYRCPKTMTGTQRIVKNSWNEFVIVDCSVCLTCGFVMESVNDLQIGAIRRWKREAEARKSGTITKPQPQAAKKKPLFDPDFE